VGKDATLECKVFGSPKPEVKWANKLLASGIEGVHYSVDQVAFWDKSGFSCWVSCFRVLEQVNAEGVSRLRLKNVKKTDADEYSCFFKNTEGNDSAIGRLHVRGEYETSSFHPKKTWFIKTDGFPTDATVFTVQPHSTEVAAGKRLILPCQVAHDPLLVPDFQWLHYNRPITNDWAKVGVRVDPHNHALVVDEPSGNLSGNYTCRVVTSLDSVEHSVTVLVKGETGIFRISVPHCIGL